MKILTVPQLFRIFTSQSLFKELALREKYVAPNGLALQDGETLLLAIYRKKHCDIHTYGNVWTGAIINELLRSCKLKEFRFTVPNEQKLDFIRALNESSLKASERYDSDCLISLRLPDPKRAQVALTP